jgi:hypothetical protein
MCVDKIIESLDPFSTNMTKGAVAMKSIKLILTVLSHRRTCLLALRDVHLVQQTCH